MKKTIYTIIAILLLTAGASAIQPSLLSVGSSGFSIKSGTVFSVKGLVLTPSADVTITNNSIRFSGTAITNGSDQSINRVYTFTSPQSSYSGLVGIQYGIGELNGNTESALQIAYNPLSSGGSFVVSSGSNTGSAGSYYISNALSSVNLGVVTALPTVFPPPTATTNAATSIALTEAVLNGSVNANSASTTVTFEYGTTISYGTTVTATPGTATSSSTTMVSYALTGLTPNTTYHYRVVGVSPGGTTNGDDQTFTTSTAGPTITGNPPNRTICVGSNTYLRSYSNRGYWLPMAGKYGQWIYKSFEWRTLFWHYFGDFNHNRSNCLNEWIYLPMCCNRIQFCKFKFRNSNSS